MSDKPRPQDAIVCGYAPEGQLVHCWHDRDDEGRSRVCCYCGRRQHLIDVLGEPEGHGRYAPPVFAHAWKDDNPQHLKSPTELHEEFAKRRAEELQDKWSVPRPPQEP